MNALASLKAACTSTGFKSFKSIQPGEYIVTNFEKCKTDHGNRLRISIDNYYMYLPARFNDSLTQDDIDDLNKSPKIMVYGGKDANQQNRLILDFKDASYFTDMFPAEEFYV